MNAKCKVGTVNLEYVKNVGNLDLLSFLLLCCLNSVLSLNVTLNGEEIVEEYEKTTKNCSSDSSNGITNLGLAENLEENRNSHHTNCATYGRTEATCRRERSTLCVVGSHNTEKRSHTDVHDGITKLEDDLGYEEYNGTEKTVEETGKGEQRDKSDRKNGNGSENPRTELIGLVLSLREHNVHKCTNERVVDCIPNVPYQKNTGINKGIYTKNVTCKTFKVGDEQKHTYATCVAAAVADVMQSAQLCNGFLCHFENPPKYFIYFCATIL